MRARHRNEGADRERRRRRECNVEGCTECTRLDRPPTRQFKKARAKAGSDRGGFGIDRINAGGN